MSGQGRVNNSFINNTCMGKESKKSGYMYMY